MKIRILTFLTVFACLIMAASLFAQSDAVTGSWAGDWGPNAYDRNNITLDLKWDGKALTGHVTGGENVSDAIPLQKGMFDPKTGAIHMEADARGRGGATVHFIIDGKVDNGAITGSWNHDNRKGDFKLRKK